MFDVFYLGEAPGIFPHERPADSLDHARNLSNTRFCWIINDLTDYTGWDFLWEPVPWQAHQRHAWSSQWQKDSGTYLLPKTEWNETNYHNDKVLKRLPSKKYWTVPNNVEEFDYSWHPDPLDPPYVYQFGTKWQKTGGPKYITPGGQQIKYVDQIKTDVTPVASHVVVIDHLDGNIEVAVKQIQEKVDSVSTVRYFDNYLDLLKRIARNNQDHEYIWICSSICDYSNFDFTWHPEHWQSNMLHVFPSNEQKFGDTFFMNTETFVKRSETLKLLDWYDVNFLDIAVPRLSPPIIQHNYDTHVEAVKNISWTGPLAVFTVDKVENTVTVPLWRQETKAVVPLSKGASQVIVPSTAVPFIKTQFYDYTHIDKTQRHLHDEQPLDIVFIENGEPNAQENFAALLESVGHSKNKIHGCSGVKGRVAAYHYAAQLSETPWFFAVFAKLRVNTDFDWSWQPDRLQEPKHYIFHAFNPINGLTYGHQAMIAYNKKLVLANSGVGLDFTLDSAHEVVPIVSGTAEYAHSPWMAWRTAFRECLKLKSSTDIESKYRLDKWLTVAMGQPYGQWSIYGAQDAVEYYEAVCGDLTELKKSYDWEWLASYAMLRRNLTPDPQHTQLLSQ